MMKKLLLAALLGLTSPGHAQVAQVDPGNTSGGQAQYYTNREFKASEQVKILTVIANPTPAQARVAQQAAAILERNPSLAIMVVERGRIVYEGYRAPASASSRQFSMSMSKSLTAYTIGAIYCDGKIASLDDPAQKYAPELRGTVYGEATIRNLLTMSSGVSPALSSGSRYPEEFPDMRGHKISVVGLLKRYPDRDTGMFGPQASGKEFRYSSTDTFALAVVADNLGGLLNYFERYFWRPAGTELSGYWLLDSESRAIAAAGVSASMRDWARLGMYTIHQIKNGSKCMREYMQAATTQQIPNAKKAVGRAFDGYGYQTWTNLRFGSGRGFWWSGYGGQRIGIDPEQEKIIIVSSWREDYMEEVYKLFADFQTSK